ncbi:hypothetical protein SKAU_G00271900 [Synaphobranchus kaupii]|uniref:Uncharacterized protein n=1 Tax=Synaphobranchus kaupii TaxID=118154 RepID=A0A9Q1IQP6_SYNKA|nr:hypothetical protein SKAU_G00271900 [Synaphobranchus kaupii]
MLAPVFSLSARELTLERTAPRLKAEGIAPRRPSIIHSGERTRIAGQPTALPPSVAAVPHSNLPLCVQITAAHKQGTGDRARLPPAPLHNTNAEKETEEDGGGRVHPERYYRRLSQPLDAGGAANGPRDGLTAENNGPSGPGSHTARKIKPFP